MLAFAEHEFRLGKRGPDGQTLRETLKTVEIMTGRKPPQAINPVEFPSILRSLWKHFLYLNAARTQTMDGVNPITEIEIWAYRSNRRIHFSLWEMDALRELDRVALTA